MEWQAVRGVGHCHGWVTGSEGLVLKCFVKFVINDKLTKYCQPK